MNETVGEAQPPAMGKAATDLRRSWNRLYDAIRDLIALNPWIPDRAHIQLSLDDRMTSPLLASDIRAILKSQRSPAPEAKAEPVATAFANAPAIVELPDDLRIPLHSLKADLRYLIGRVVADGSVGEMIGDSIAERLSQIETAAYRLANAAPPPDERRKALEEAARLCDESAAEAERLLAEVRPEPGETLETERLRISRTSWLNTARALAADLRDLSDKSEGDRGQG